MVLMTAKELGTKDGQKARQRHIDRQKRPFQPLEAAHACQAAFNKRLFKDEVSPGDVVTYGLAFLDALIPTDTSLLP